MIRWKRIKIGEHDMDDTLQVTLSIIAVGLAIIGLLVPLLVAVLKLYSRVDRLTWSVDQIRWSADQIKEQGNAHLTVTGALVGSLTRRGTLNDDDMGRILEAYTAMGQLPTAPPNPLTLDEQASLDSYIDLARRGGPFTPEQVQDYRTLVDTLEREHPDDRANWSLVSLGAFLFGLYVVGRQKDDAA